MGILTIFGLYIFEVIKYTKKFYLPLQDQNPRHKYNTRNKNYIVDQHNLEFFTKSPTYIGLKLINRLPTQLTKEVNFEKFVK